MSDNLMQPEELQESVSQQQGGGLVRRAYRKKSFDRPKHYDVVFRNADGSMYGTLRIKTNSMLWRWPKEKKFRSRPLGEIVEFIVENGRSASR